jgi:hypothetical protein
MQTKEGDREAEKYAYIINVYYVEYCISDSLNVIMYAFIGENCIMRSFITCTLRQV